MRIVQARRGVDGRWTGTPVPAAFTPQLGFVFVAADLADPGVVLAEVAARSQGAVLVGTSTAGEIHGDEVADGSVSLTLVEFDRTPVQVATVPTAGEDSRVEGRQLAAGLPRDGLAHVFVLFEGLRVNGTDLVAGLRDVLPAGVGVTGGLAGDGDRFRATFVLHGGQRVRGAAVGFYGDSIRFGCASLGGWDDFGPQRRITRASGNVLYELDGRPALDLYRQYLGEHAARLPASALLFPLCIRRSRADRGLVRTILGCDDATGSMTFAGDVPEGAIAQLMRANVDRLIEGAEGAATASVRDADWQPELALLISCVGRKLVLRHHTEEEVLAVRRVFGDRTACAGFYSYGEISPFTPTAECELHNQTMTITTLAEV